MTISNYPVKLMISQTENGFFILPFNLIYYYLKKQRICPKEPTNLKKGKEPDDTVS